jgi:Farnesoic acid 0-methyl transferase
MRLALCAFALSLVACKVRELPPIDQSYADSFDEPRISGDYHPTGTGYRVVDGALNAHGAHNHPLWLARKLPPGNVQIDVDVWSASPDGDIKLELFGDGTSFDPDGNRYTATSYVVVFGAWKNSRSIIARLDEHGKDIVARTDIKVVANRRYHWRLVRTAGTLDWYVDDLTTPFLHYVDPVPLLGPGHEYFGFDNWETDTYFDNLVIRHL